MKLEAVDKKNPTFICVATVTDMVDNRFLVHFDNWDESYDYWYDVFVLYPSETYQKCGSFKHCFCDSFQTVDTVTVPTFARLIIMATKVCLSGILEESSFPCQLVCKKCPEIVLEERSCVLLHLELWTDFSLQLHSIS